VRRRANPFLERLISGQRLHCTGFGSVRCTARPRLPAAFGDLVCDALAHGKHVTVALERVTKEQPILNSIVNGANLEEAEGKLHAEPGWQLFLDGRSSQAMLSLLVRLRELDGVFALGKRVTASSPANAAALEAAACHKEFLAHQDSLSR
jgi:hypothetical protein